MITKYPDSAAHFRANCSRTSLLEDIKDEMVLVADESNYWHNINLPS